jgi:DNA polymerase III alpha subunit (gram-positive type)
LPHEKNNFKIGTAKMKKLWIDCETTGLNYHIHDIIQLALIIDDSENNVISEYFWNIKPDNFDTIEQTALDINGVTIDELKTYIDSDIICKEFVTVLKSHLNNYEKYVFCGYNCPFDIEFVKKFLSNHNIDWMNYFTHNTVDVLAFLRYYNSVFDIKSINFKLKNTYKCFLNGDEIIKSIGNNFHNALFDIRITRRLYYKLNCLLLDYNIGTTK